MTRFLVTHRKRAETALPHDIRRNPSTFLLAPRLFSSLKLLLAVSPAPFLHKKCRFLGFRGLKDLLALSPSLCLGPGGYPPLLPGSLPLFCLRSIQQIRAWAHLLM